jgi:hypothetical protein
MLSSEIKTTPAVPELEYDEGMDDDDKAETAFSCEFFDKPNSGKLKSTKH